ncbi:Uncharacterized protein TCM_043251 [Theobroma cacao]|uniref:RNase H type-1 domain-containing protein n=1 Tax=Theobroma cacao TaxID=3641 RepID=A0A061FN75_THECC|nr:Uncharacterized protein TCM_043251 [Theobroma cacao]
MSRLFDTLKFNVDGTSKRKPREVSTGGVIRDEVGAVKHMFSKVVGVMDCKAVELVAMKEVFMMFGSSKRVYCYGYFL